jgi:opacity protein-like surface antigen
VLLLSVALCAAATAASAQDAPELRAHRLTINAGIAWLGGYDIGVSTAELRGNGNGTTPPPFALLTADSHFTSANAPELRVGFALSNRWTIEGGGQWSQPHIGVGISGDAEAPAQELPGEQLQQYIFDGSVNWQLPVAMGRRLAPFVSGGAGYLRQLHEDRMYAETGRIYYAGGGARFWLRGGHGATRPIGVRGELRINMRHQGIDFANQTRAYPTFSLFAFVGV